MVVKLFICIALIGCLTQPYTSADCSDELDERELPPCLDAPINASISAINLMLDDAQLGIHTKQAITMPVILEMNRSIGEGGPILELISLGRGVFDRFLTNVGSTSNTISTEVTQIFRKAVREVETHLWGLLEKCEVEKLIAKIEALICNIEGHIAKMTAGNQDRYLGLYGDLSNKLQDLHSNKCSCQQVYSNKLEGILKFGSGNFNRFINDVGNRVERYLNGIANQIRALILAALNPSCHQFIREKP